MIKLKRKPAYPKRKSEYKRHYRKKEGKMLTLRVKRDDMLFDPRAEYDNFGTMYCWHSKYNLGDRHEFGKEYPEEFIDNMLKNAFHLPLYLYDHSGITMNTVGFSCGWDSGQVGWIFVSKEDVRKEFGVTRISAKLKERVYDLLRNEVKIYDYFLTGDVWGYELVETTECSHCGETKEEILDSCWGYCGQEEIESVVKELTVNDPLITECVYEN